MGWWEAIVLGAVQGLTEFLPISSSAHLRLVGEATGGDPGAAFTAVTQIGTETAVVIYFRRDIARIVRAWFAAVLGRGSHSDPDARMGWLVIVGSVPIVVSGLLLEDAITSTFRLIAVVAVMLAVFAVFLFLADRYGRKTRTLDQLTWTHGVIFGFAQAMALVPGVSRSGGTITAGLLLGYTREASARYAFLLAIPAVYGSGLYTMRDIGLDGSVAWGPTVAATLVAFAVGYVVIVQFMKFISNNSYTVFVVYRIALSAVVFALLGAGVLSSTAGA